MQVYKNGTKCYIVIGDKKIDGIINEISIKGENKVAYNVSYYDEGLKTWRCEEFEIDTNIGEKMSIGFKV